ncbi:hypothetical protein [Nocardia veterana]|uniref:Uncharacterized protein n=2 Tax=Nocardia veterana TaxID=132249 RepID=A0A7X6RKP0_9NOCA|nr:hypothetical protein [Nocardia veterana]NKY88913.1 hypothetical protein [Nocardia veterana]
MTTATIRHLVATELEAAAAAYRRAVDGPDPAIEAEAGERWNQALAAATALLQADLDAYAARRLAPGDPVLWLHTAAVAVGEPLPILAARVITEAHPGPVDDATPIHEPWYVVEIEDGPWFGPTERTVSAGDLIALPPTPALETRHAG